MDFIQIIVMVLHITLVFSKSKSKKKRYDSSSEEDTIENLLYYKDCQKNPRAEVTTHSPVPLRMTLPPPPPPPPQPECPFPKMCCALSCGNDCGGNQEGPLIARQMEPIQRQHQAFQPFPSQAAMPQPRQPALSVPLTGQAKKRKRPKFMAQKVQPIASRRDFGFTKEKIKSLISRDDEIRKILKDLVRVTMLKVNMLDGDKPNAHRPETGPDEGEANGPPLEMGIGSAEDGYIE